MLKIKNRSKYVLINLYEKVLKKWEDILKLEYISIEDFMVGCSFCDDAKIAYGKSSDCTLCLINKKICDKGGHKGFVGDLVVSCLKNEDINSRKQIVKKIIQTIFKELRNLKNS